MIEVDRIPLKHIPQRYGIARSLLYTRMKDLEIKPEKDSKQAYLNALQLAQLDALNDHIRQGGTTTEFLSEKSNITQNPHSANISNDSSRDGGATFSDASSGEEFNQTRHARVADPEKLAWRNSTATHSLTTPNLWPSFYFPSKYLHLQYLECLDRAASQNWLLTTLEVKKLLGVSPVGARYVRGSFAFIKCGKIGRQIGWRIEKLGIITEEKSVAGGLI